MATIVTVFHFSDPMAMIHYMNPSDLQIAMLGQDNELPGPPAGYSMIYSVPVEDNSLDTEHCEAAYRATQNIDAPWRPEEPCRSTAVGDVIGIKRPEGVSRRYVVTGMGFKLLPHPHHA